MVLCPQFKQIQLCWFTSVNNYTAVLDLGLRKMSLSVLIMLILAIRQRSHLHKNDLKARVDLTCFEGWLEGL